MQKYICISCGYIYNPEKGDRIADIPPRTPFEELPDDWTCPMCDISKENFDPVD
jgi:rubredoxin